MPGLALWASIANWSYKDPIFLCWHIASQAASVCWWCCLGNSSRKLSDSRLLYSAGMVQRVKWKKKMQERKITGLRSKRSQNFQYMKHTEKETNILWHEKISWLKIWFIVTIFYLDMYQASKFKLSTKNVLSFFRLNFEFHLIFSFF